LLLSKAKLVQGICQLEQEQQQKQLLQQQQQEGEDLELSDRGIFVDGCEKCLQEMMAQKNYETQSQNQFRPIFTTTLQQQQQRHNITTTTTTTTSEGGRKRQERQFHSI